MNIYKKKQVMLLEQKDILKNIINKNYYNFLTQVQKKINRKIAKNADDASELLSDVLFNILNKLEEDPEFLLRCIEMNNKQKFISYIGKALDIQARYSSAPFLRAKLNKHLPIFDYQSVSSICDEEYNEDEIEDEVKIKQLLILMQPSQAKALLGEAWKYYLKMFKEYATTETTYIKLAKKYGIEVSGLYQNIIYTKEQLKEKLKELS